MRIGFAAFVLEDDVRLPLAGPGKLGNGVHAERQTVKDAPRHPAERAVFEEEVVPA